MKILVFGKTGQVARELSEFDDVVNIGRADADFDDSKACADIILQGDYDAVINAVAYTAVDKAEEFETEATQVNAVTPGALAKAAKDKGIPIVHISTDYVFNGTGLEAWEPTDKTDPQSVYGRSKLEGEGRIQSSGANFVILRTSWVFSRHGHNFVKTMLRLGAEHDSLKIVSDQIGGPTPAKDIAYACHEIANALVKDPGKGGIYHFSGTPEVSWAEFAQAIFQEANLDCKVYSIPTNEYPTPAARPLNSRLNCENTENIFGIERPNWKQSLKDLIRELQ